MGVIHPEDDKKILAKSTARNKKVAEQEASRLALIALGAGEADATRLEGTAEDSDAARLEEEETG
jgi:hypothetical protein